MNGFYDIAEEGKKPEHPLQLENFGPQIPMLTIGSSSSRNDWEGRESRSQTFYRATTEEDYDNAFVRKIEETYPPYKIELLLDHHYEQYISKVPTGHKSFVKHIRYAVLSAIKGDRRDVFTDIINEWLNGKKEIITIEPTAMSTTQKLNKVLEFIVSHQDRININAYTIQKTIFDETITFNEAQELFLTILRTGKTRVIGHRYLAHSLETSMFLENGGFGGEHNHNTTIIIKPAMLSQENELEIMKVFVTYAWGDAEHENKVLAFTNYLRGKGIHAEMDKMLSQSETTINFKKMMHLAMQYPKVIVVLSGNYKVRADTFAGGVGTEYTMLINDIGDNPKKYILVSFDGRSKNIVPFGLNGNDIVDLSLADGDETLFRKLTDQHKYIFAEVAPEHPKFDPVQIGDFQAVDPKKIVSIEDPTVKQGGGYTQGGLYRSVEFDMQLHFKNISGKPLEGFSYDVKLKQQLMPELYDQLAKDGFLIFNDDLSQKIFPNRPIQGKNFKIKINSHLIRQILGTKVTITVYTDHGEYSREFAVEALFKARPHGIMHGEPVPLTRELFG